MNTYHIYTGPRESDFCPLRKVIPALFLILTSLTIYSVDGYSEISDGCPSVASETKLVGTLTDSATGNPISNALVSLDGLTNNNTATFQKSVTDKNGKFEFQFLVSHSATVTYQAEGYQTIRDRGLVLQACQDLSKVMHKIESVGGWWVLLLLIPGILGLVVAFWKEVWEGSAGSPPAVSLTSGPPPPTPQPRNSQFMVAMLSGLIWGGTLAAVFWFGELYKQDIYTIRLLTNSLTFELYIPILGFLGALLYVLDLSRKGKQEIPKGKEFGMRLIMGPYVAIVMVLLFGHELAFANLTAPVAQGTIAFFSGLLVVTALQGLIERAQEKLGKWRDENLDESSKIADRLGLSRDEELILRKSEFEKDKLEKALGDPVWKKLKSLKITTVEEFAHLTDQSLEQIAAQVEPPADIEDLKILRTKAKKFGNLQ